MKNCKQTAFSRSLEVHGSEMRFLWMACVDLTVAQASSAHELGELDNLCVILFILFFFLNRL